MGRNPATREAIKIKASKRDAFQAAFVNIKRNLLVNDHCDPEAVGREIGVMADYDRLAEE
jgi:hypothetical protein